MIPIKKIYPILLSLLSLITLQACDNMFSLTSPVDPAKFEKQGRRLVVNSFISPQDSLIRVEVSRSSPLFGEPPAFESVEEIIAYNFVQDAEVIISDGETEARLTYTEENNGDTRLNAIRLYNYVIPIAEFPIVAGKTYILTVTTPEGETATASTSIPDKPDLREVNLTMHSQERGYCTDCPLEYYYIMTVKWTDQPETEDIYRLIGEIEGIRIEEYTSRETRYDTNYTQSTYWKGPEKEYIEDLNLKSSEVELEIKLTANPRPVDSTYYSESRVDPDLQKVILKSQRFHLSLLSISPEYKVYLESLEKLGQTTDNPFAEPIPIYSNFDGAVGIFASSNRSTSTHELPDFVYDRDKWTE